MASDGFAVDLEYIPSPLVGGFAEADDTGVCEWCGDDDGKWIVPDDGTRLCLRCVGHWDPTES